MKALLIITIVLACIILLIVKFGARARKMKEENDLLYSREDDLSDSGDNLFMH